MAQEGQRYKSSVHAWAMTAPGHTAFESGAPLANICKMLDTALTVKSSPLFNSYAGEAAGSDRADLSLQPNPKRHAGGPSLIRSSCLWAYNNKSFAKKTLKRQNKKVNLKNCRDGSVSPEATAWRRVIPRPLIGALVVARACGTGDVSGVTSGHLVPLF